VQLHWIVYLFGALSMLFLKLWYFVFVGRQAGKPFSRIAFEFFVMPEQGKTIGSWLVSIAGVWLLGALLVDRITLFNINFTALPEHHALDFFYGVSAEAGAPKFCTWMWSKMFPEMPRD